MTDETLFQALKKEATDALTISKQTAKPLIEFHSPTELRNYQPPEGSVLVGDNHIVRGAFFVIGGAPGVGKSRASVALAVAGATQMPWFDLKVPRQFRTMIVQNENGRLRLAEEFSALDCAALDAWVRVCPPPPFGLAFRDDHFQAALVAAIDGFKPDVILIDPWNAVVADDKAKDYIESFNLLRTVMPAGDDRPAIGIVAHTRKPKYDERASGRGLLNLMSGSHVLGSVPRSVFVIQPANDEPENDQIVFTCCKNNDGKLGPQSAWTRRNGLFAPVHGFDWKQFGKPESNRKSITAEEMSETFGGGKKPLLISDAVKTLIETTGCGQSAAYSALKTDGRFEGHLIREGKTLRWNP